MAELVKVDSSMIYAVSYDEEKEILEAVFNTGSIWCYEGVPKEVYKELLEADSIGRFMRSEIIGCYDEYQISKKGRR